MKDLNISGKEKKLNFDVSVENELLMLKLKAEFGAECIRGSGQVPSEVVNQFLRSVYAFEHKLRKSPQLISIYDQIGRPPFRKASELSDRELTAELKRLQHLLHKHRIRLEARGHRSPREIYRFITEEFFEHQIGYLDFPGYTSHFCYEDFHPDHEAEVEQRLAEFLTAWFGRRLDATGIQLAETLVLPDGRCLGHKEAVQRIGHLFEAFPSFADCWYRIDQLCLVGDSEGSDKEATVDGFVQYKAVMETGEPVQVKGPLRLRLSAGESGWRISGLEMAGFSWSDQDAEATINA